MAPRTARNTSKTSKKTQDVVEDLPLVGEVDFEDLDNGPQARADEERATGMVTADGKRLRTEILVFRGRSMEVQVPDEVQLAVIKRFSDQYGSMTSENERRIEAKQAITMSGRAISIIQSVLASPDDRDWIEDGLLRRDFDLMEALDIVNDAMVMLQAANAPNREERRKAAKKSRLVTD